MDVFEAIRKRHSYRAGFKDEPVPREDLVAIVDAGIRAPSGVNAQTTQFVIVDDAERIAALAGIVDKRVVREAKAIIVCVVDHRAVYEGMAFGAEDCAAAVENMLLAITALGYATVWLDGVLRVEDKGRRVANLLGVPENLEVRVMLPLGVPAEERPQRERMAFDQRAWFNHYGQDRAVGF